MNDLWKRTFKMLTQDFTVFASSEEAAKIKAVFGMMNSFEQGVDEEDRAEEPEAVPACCIVRVGLHSWR